MRPTTLALLMCAVFAGPFEAQEPAATVAALTAEATKAYRAKDYARFLSDEKRALALEPSNARLIYNVACGEALQGNAAEATRLLGTLAARKLDLGAETDGDFAKIRTSPEWKKLEGSLTELRKPVVHSQVAFRLPDPGLLSLGIAIDAATGDTYVASLRQRKIVRRTKAGEVSDFIREAQDGFLAGASILLDAPRHLLYASTGAVPFMAGYRKEDSGKSGVFAFDLNSGKLVRSAMLPPDGKQHFLNAMVLDRNGTIFVSDSQASGIYKLSRNAANLEVFIPPDVFNATQGLALSDDERTLYVADFTDGLWALDMASKARHHLDAPPDSYLAGLDGLSPVPGGFIAVQIGVKPERVLRITLGEQGKRVAAVDVLEMNHPDYAGPIQGVVSAGAFFYVANSQLELGNPETGAFAAERGRPTIVLRLPL